MSTAVVRFPNRSLHYGEGHLDGYSLGDRPLKTVPLNPPMVIFIYSRFVLDTIRIFKLCFVFNLNHYITSSFPVFLW